MGNQHEIRQVSPREGLGVVVSIRAEHTVEVARLLAEDQERGHQFYIHLRPAFEPIEFPNLDGPEVAINPQPRDHIVIQSGGKMWSGYDRFVDRVRTLAPHLDDAVFFVGDEHEFIDELRISAGALIYRRVHQGGWRPVSNFIQSMGLTSGSEPC